MKYYRLYNSAEVKDVGHAPQITEGLFEEKYDHPKALNRLLFNQQINPDTIIPQGKMHNKAKLTDLMSVSFLSNQFFVSDKLKNIFQEFNIEGVQFAKSSIYSKSGTRMNFNIIHPYFSNIACLDVRRSEFYFTNIMVNKYISQIQFTSIDEYLRAYKKNQADAPRVGFPNFQPLVIKTISFIPDCSLDLFSVFGINYGGVGYFVSERLKQKVLEEKCTGVIFKDINECYP